MPLFYFHIVSADATFLDEDGLRFTDREAAMAHATDLVTELARSIGSRGTIVVENDDDGELFEVPLAGP